MAFLRRSCLSGICLTVLTPNHCRQCSRRPLTCSCQKIRKQEIPEGKVGIKWISGPTTAYYSLQREMINVLYCSPALGS